MILSQTAVYALRAMSVLARLSPGESLPAAELAGRTGVPVHYLGKVMRRLVIAGLAQSRKGHGGGFALRLPAQEISFADVLAAAGVAAAEPGLCAFGWGRCNPENPCALHPFWTKLQEMLDDWAKSVTLEETRNVTKPTDGP